MSDQLSAARDGEALFPRFRRRKCAESFRRLVEAYAGLVQGTAARVLGNGESARDVSQAVFADLARLAPELPDDTALGGWLHRHTVFLALRQRRADRRRGAREVEAQRRWALDHGGVESPPWMADLDETLNRLSSEDRQVLMLRYFENQPLRAVAGELGIGEDAAQKRAARALEKLRALLARRGFHGAMAAALPTAISALAPSSGNAAVLASAAFRAAATSAIPSAGTWTTFFAMNLKPILTGALAAAALTGGVLTPIILNQRGTIASLEERLKSSPDRMPETKSPTLARLRKEAVVPAPKPNTRRGEYEEYNARFEPVKDRIEAWTKAVMQVDDAAMKQKALDEMRAAMVSSDDKQAFAALAAYRGVGGVEFDRTAFRPAIVGLLSHRDAVMRRTALGFVATLPPDKGDIARVTAMAGDADYGVRKGVVASLFWLTKGDLTGDSGNTVLGILKNAETPTRSLIDTMWGAKFSPELERKLVEFARAERQPDDEELPYYAVYSCLSTQNNKGPACVDLLIERLIDADSYNVGGRAAWGLAYGVQPGLGLETKIADAAIKVWRNRSDGSLRNSLLKCIDRYGDESHAATLDEIATAPAMGAEQKKQLTDLAAMLRQRKPSTE
jgi:RNA polymerase sigma factor (sigma-70 family)